ncbi:MAG: hypothetical protein DMF75_14700 [Acidobacteria bacterium]|nr:MAG: hypothetical protein DMF75_14700 [Acidobacteriota bacterium]
MPIRITIDIFSGRENPVVELSAKESQDVLERLKPAEPLVQDEAEKSATPILGYRGLIIEQTGPQAAAKDLPSRFRVASGNLVGGGMAHRASDPGFEDFFFSNKGYIKKLKDVTAVRKILNQEVPRARDVRDAFTIQPLPFPIFIICSCAPLYEPAWWNDGGQKQLHNNCYNYACNYRSDTFAQPGRAAGAMYTALTCASVKPAAVKDALEDQPGANNKCPEEGHLVALVIAPNVDFHWYRKGRNGYWSHKPGSTQVTNVDNSGHLISDPRTANRGMYTDFCTFMVVKHGHIKIN